MRESNNNNSSNSSTGDYRVIRKAIGEEWLINRENTGAGTEEGTGEENTDDRFILSFLFDINILFF